MNELIKEAKETLTVSTKSAKDYEEKKNLMLEFVNQEMSKRSDVVRLIGGNPLQMMYDNHRNHVNFMVNVFKYSLFEMLVKIVPWVYKSYHNHDFSYDYFPSELSAWKKATKKFLHKNSAEEINKTYDWLIEKHERMIELSKEQSYFIIPLESKWQTKKDKFLSYLLDGNSEAALKFAKKFIKSQEDILNFHLKIVQPSLYDVGNLWEAGKISVAEEHLATAIVGRVMANIYVNFPKTKKKAKAIVMSAPNEYHELGGRIVADFLEIDGWDVYYLGANVPEQGLIRLIKKTKPKLLAISVTMPFNIEKTEKLISSVRELRYFNSKIIVGGIAFNIIPEIYEKIGADFYAPDAKRAVDIAQQFKNL
ncbi:MAG: cobalamin-dependent protein [Syntrophales bacterium]|nr:cobalamin-dependent protein [Syntrophales bacterium]